MSLFAGAELLFDLPARGQLRRSEELRHRRRAILLPGTLLKGSHLALLRTQLVRCTAAKAVTLRLAMPEVLNAD
jgi:hypothetical protein